MAKTNKLINKDPVTGTVTSVSHEGRGIVHHEGRPYFVDGALLGEVITLEPQRRRRRITEARILDVVQAAPERVIAKCKHADICGGCSLQHMAPEAQVALKQHTLLDNLHHFGNTKAVEVLQPVTASPWGYRRKARLGVKYVDKKERLLIGFREKSSRYLADIEHCEVLHPKIADLFTPLRDLISSLTIMREIPQIEVALGDDKLAMVFRNLVAATPDDEQKFIAFGAQYNVEVYLQPGNEDTIKRIHPTDGDPDLTYFIGSEKLALNFKPTDFVQVNGNINQLMIERLLELLQLTKDDTVLDLFCGVGNISLPLAAKAKYVVGVEGDQRLTTRAKANALKNNLTNAEFHDCDLSKDFTSASWLAKDYAKLVIDPPRSGALECIRQLAGKRFERIVYVSCNPATLARDAGVLVHEQGYVLQKAGVLDMFPHTAHTESIALFTRK